MPKSSAGTANVFSLILGGLLVVLSIPLILQKVPPNGLYGFRTEKTLSSDAIWYEANARAGVALLVAGAVVLVGALVLRGKAETMQKSSSSRAHVLLALGPMAVVAIYCFFMLRQL